MSWIRDDGVLAHLGVMLGACTLCLLLLLGCKAKDRLEAFSGLQILYEDASLSTDANFQRSAAEPDTHAYGSTAPVVSLYRITLASPAADVRARFEAIVRAWADAYPIPGLTVYLRRYHRGDYGLSWRDLHGVPEIHLGWFPCEGVPVLADLDWEFSRRFADVDDPPPLGNGPVDLGLDHLTRRALAIQEAAK